MLFKSSPFFLATIIVLSAGHAMASGGVAADKSDTIIYDIEGGKSAGGFGHPACGGKEVSVLPSLEKVRALPKAEEQ